MNLKDQDLAIEGVLFATRGPWLTLRNAAVLKAGEPPMPADGEVIVHRDNVAFIQVEGS